MLNSLVIVYLITLSGHLKGYFLKQPKMYLIFLNSLKSWPKCNISSKLVYRNMLAAVTSSICLERQIKKWKKQMFPWRLNVLRILGFFKTLKLRREKWEEQFYSGWMKMLAFSFNLIRIVFNKARVSISKYLKPWYIKRISSRTVRAWSQEKGLIDLRFFFGKKNFFFCQVMLQ